MFKLAVAFWLFPLILSAQTKSQDPKWFFCKVDADCITVEGICSSATAINRNFKKEALEFYNWRSSTDRCAPSQKAAVLPTSRCTNQMCSLRNTP